ncbi:lipoyl synthase, partial [Chloroflexota bacterium]
RGRANEERKRVNRASSDAAERTPTRVDSPLRMPEWLRRPIPRGPQVNRARRVVDHWGLHTVCESAACPNRLECYSGGKLTFMILGDTCTRNCSYCKVNTGKPLPPDPSEPERLASAAKELGLDYVVITSVCRDDLLDSGASHFAATVEALRTHSPNSLTEVLIPDFGDSLEDLRTLLSARPAVLNHNIETVPRLYPQARRQGKYDWAIELLGRVKNISPETPTKSGLMLGLGESRVEVIAALEDLRHVNCDVVTLGQYVRPSLTHWPVDRYVTPEEFAEYEAIGRDMGFAYIASGPLVRSSFMAKEIASALTHRNPASQTSTL